LYLKSAAYLEAMTHLAPRGRLVVFFGLLPVDDAVAVSLNQLHYYEQTLVGAYGCAYRHGVQALARLADGTVAVEDMISHRRPLKRLDEALGMVAKRESTKILLYPEF
jgi:L-iditol 2-dehydrogenase